MEKQDFIAKIKQLSETIEKISDKISNEEQTKNALIMPFFMSLGYNIFDPTEFIPEFTADVGIKKGERVDYAIQLNDAIAILIEAKELGSDLNNHSSQLQRYFNVTDAKFSILTNGDEYRFFTDLDKPNIMDENPFLTIHLSNIKDNQINELFKFVKENFDSDKISSTASDLKYVSQISNFFTSQISSPSDDFVREVLKEMGYEGQKNARVIEEFKPIIGRGIQVLINERVNEKLSHALDSTKTADVLTTTDDSYDKEEKNKIVTTSEELEVYTIAKAILRNTLGTDRIFYRDNTAYFNVLIDDNIRKWVLRAFFNSVHSWIILNDENSTRIDFNNSVDLINYSDQIIAITKQYL